MPRGRVAAALLSVLCAPGAWASPSSWGGDLGVDFGSPEALAGCDAWMEVDVQDDGGPEWVWRYRFDARGLLRTVDGEALFGGKGTPRMAYTYDAQDRLVLQSWDTNRDGAAERVYTYRYVGDQLTEKVETDSQLGVVGRLELAWSGDRVAATRVEHRGEATAWATNHYEGGRLTDTTRYDDAGRPAEVRWYEFDPLGHHVGTLTDSGADGFPDSEDRDERDRLGRLVERTTDADYDGRADQRSRLSWRCPVK